MEKWKGILAMHSLFVLLLVGLTVGLTVPAQAALIDRGLFDTDGVPGGPTVRLVYDDDLNITWLGDANFANTSGLNGLMTWQNAVNWAASLTVGGFTDWRLPTTTQPDPTCSVQTGGGSSGQNCTGSEMGHLFYSELGGTAGSSILTSGDPDLALFKIGFLGPFWSSTEFAPNTDGAWLFLFNDGTQGFRNKFISNRAWAVRDGDVATAASFDLYGTTSSTSFGNPNTLLRVDPNTGGQTLAGPVGLATNTTDIDWNPLTQTLFGSNLFDNGGVIQEIDPATGVATPIATIRQGGNPVRLWALAFTSNGMALWGVAGNNAITGLTLGLIDLNTEIFSPQLALPPRLAVAGIDIAPNGVLYGIFKSLLPEPFRQTLFTIDLETPSIIDQQVLSSTFNIDDIDFAPDGFIYHTNFSAFLFRLDPNTGTTTNVGGGNLGALGGLASPGLQNLNDSFAPLGPGDVATAFSFTPCGGASAGTFTITATFTNISSDTLSNLLISVQTLTGGNVLCNANGGPGGAGATLTVPLEGDLADGQLSPGESFVVELPVGLQSFNPFTFLVDVLGEED